MTPQVAPFSRSRLVVFASQARSSEKRDRATSMVMSYESVMDEASFMIGPVLVGVLTFLIAPWAPLVFAAGITATVILAFALHPSALSSAKASRGLPPASIRVVLSKHVIALAMGMFCVGAVFGSILTALTEFMTILGVGELTGIAYGAMSAGAILIAFTLAAFPRFLTLPSRWILFAATSILGAAVLVMASSLSVVLLALFVCGCGIGAVLIALFSLGAQVSPLGSSTTILTTLQSTLVIGQAVATGTSGIVIATWGASSGFLITVVMATLLTLVGIIYNLNFRKIGLK
jgi:hypothetical protein